MRAGGIGSRSISRDFVGDIDETEEGFAEIGEEWDEARRGEGIGEIERDGRELLGIGIGAGDPLRGEAAFERLLAGDGAGEEFGEPLPKAHDIR